MDKAQTMQQCVKCGRTIQEVPLITLTHRDGSAYICPQCLPYLIHDPQLLVGQLPGAESLSPHEH